MNVRCWNTLQLDRRWVGDALGLEELDKRFRHLHILQRSQRLSAALCAALLYREVLYGWGYIFAINQDVVLFSKSLILFRTPLAYKLWRTPSRTLSQRVRGNTRSNTYEVFRGSVYCTPLASSRSDASFFRLAIAARISASASSAFSASVFFASGRTVRLDTRYDMQRAMNRERTFCSLSFMHLLRFHQQRSLLPRLLSYSFLLPFFVLAFILLLLLLSCRLTLVGPP